jgi:hypothetical protein
VENAGERVRLGEEPLMQEFVNRVGVRGAFANIVQARSCEDLKKYRFDGPPESVTVE